MVTNVNKRMFTFVTYSFIMDYLQLYTQFLEHKISGRYLFLQHIEPLLLDAHRKKYVAVIGESVLQLPIYKYQIGTGKIRILMWSQMHGNESTTTKAVFDLMNLLESNTDFGKTFRENFTICILPMLNPDGSKAYTRENANGIDLNRDAQNLSQPESLVLKKCFLNFNPNYCFNLHDQRTIYAVGNSTLPATVSFLAPAFDEVCSFNETRNTAISVISGMNEVLQKFIPNQVGRFDDTFNINCVGDTFQHNNVPTILFEAGHFQNDYEREETRKYIFIALFSALNTLNENVIVPNYFEKYLNIPLNNNRFLDIIYKNVNINYDNSIKTINFAAHYNEELINNKLHFSALFCEINSTDDFLGHLVYDFRNEIYQDDFDNFPKNNQKANFYLKNGIKIVNGLIKI
jgi:hypothetical protein